MKRNTANEELVVRAITEEAMKDVESLDDMSGKVYYSRELFEKIVRKCGKENAQIIYEHFFEDMKHMPVYEGEDGNLYL